MAQTLIYVREEEAANYLAKVSEAVPTLQAIHDGLKALGATDITIADIKAVVNADNPRLKIREIALREKALQIAGIDVDPSIVKLPEQSIEAIVTLAKKADPSRKLDWQFYELTGEGGITDTVSVTQDAESVITERFSVYGSELAADVVGDVEELCTAINAIGAKIGANTYHPLRYPESWIRWNPTLKKYEPDYGRLAVNIK